MLCDNFTVFQVLHIGASLNMTAFGEIVRQKMTGLDNSLSLFLSFALSFFHYYPFFLFIMLFLSFFLPFFLSFLGFFFPLDDGRKYSS